MSSRRFQQSGLGYWVKMALAASLLFTAHLTQADSDYARAWGPSLGSEVPLLSANDQDGRSQNLASLTGPNGLLMVFNRSVDW